MKICHHKEKIMALFDNENLEFSKFMEQHIQECAICGDEYKKVLNILDDIDSKIPFVLPSEKIAEEINLDVEKIISHFDNTILKKILRNFRKLFFKIRN